MYEGGGCCCKLEVKIGFRWVIEGRTERSTDQQRSKTTVRMEERKGHAA